MSLHTKINNSLQDTVSELFSRNRGLLAMDESNHTCNKRFAAAGIVQNEEGRRAYREMIITTPGLSEFIGGVILYDETIRQAKSDGTPFVQIIKEAGIIPGIKVDLGEEDLAAHPGEKITAGLDGLRERLRCLTRTGSSASQTFTRENTGSTM